MRKSTNNWTRFSSKISPLKMAKNKSFLTNIILTLFSKTWEMMIALFIWWLKVQLQWFRRIGPLGSTWAKPPIHGRERIPKIQTWTWQISQTNSLIMEMKKTIPKKTQCSTVRKIWLIFQLVINPNLSSIWSKTSERINLTRASISLRLTKIFFIKTKESKNSLRCSST